MLAICSEGMCRTNNDGVGKGIAGHEVGLWGARHAAEHLPLTHRVLAGWQLHDLRSCAQETPQSGGHSVMRMQCPF